MTQALRRLGFDKVFDTDFGADLTIMEEATELLGRIRTAAYCRCSPPARRDGSSIWSTTSRR